LIYPEAVAGSNYSNRNQEELEMQTILSLLQELEAILVQYGPAVAAGAFQAFLQGGWPAVVAYLMGLFTPVPSPTPAPATAGAVLPAAIAAWIVKAKAAANIP
jgi:hypothetical protein